MLNDIYEKNNKLTQKKKKKKVKKQIFEIIHKHV